jgi:NTE family protein
VKSWTISEWYSSELDERGVSVDEDSHRGDAPVGTIARRSELLGSLPPEELIRVESRMTPASVPAGEILLSQGSWHGVLYLVRAGVLSVDATTEAGDVRHLARLTSGECAGEMSLLSGMPSSATVSALTDSSVSVLRQPDFMELLAICPTLARNVSVILSQRLFSTIRGDDPGFARLMRLRLHPSLSVDLAIQLARSVSFYLDRPLLVMDHLGVGGWDESERISGVHDLVSGLERELNEAAGARVVVTDARSTTAESWVRFHMNLPRRQVFGLQLMGLEREDTLPDSLVRVDSEILLWPDGEERLPNGTDEAVLVAAAAHTNSVAALQSASRSSGGPVIRILAPRDPGASADIGWIARSLAGCQVGLSLGGGGARGGAHLGVLRGLKQAQVPIDYITGCSVGAGLAAGVAFGLDIDELVNMIVNFAGHVVKYTIPRHSLLSSSGLKGFYRTMVGETLIEDLAIPLAVVAADLLQAREIVFDSGLLWKAVLASTSLPGIYPPVWVGEYCLVDGGVLNPVPATITRSLGADVVLAVKLDAPGDRTPIYCRAEETRPGRSPSVISAISRSFEVMASEITAHVVDGADVVIAVEAEAMTLRDFQQGAKLLPSGTEALARDWPRIQSALPWLRRVPAPTLD